MADLLLPNAHAIHEELRAIEDAYRSETRLYLRYLEDRGLDLIGGFVPYVDSLKAGWTDTLGQRHEFSTSGWNKRIHAAKHRILYAFDRSEHSDDLTKRAQHKAHLDSAPMKKKHRGPIGSDKYLDWNEVRKLISQTPKRDPNLAPMIEFFARSGVRVAELVGIRLTDIKMNGRKAYIRIHGKGGIERTIEVEKKFVAVVIEFFGGSIWLFEHNGRQYSPNSITNRIKVVSELILEKRISSHALRHSYARHQIVDLHRSAKAVANQLGHSSTAITLDFYVEDEATGDPMMHIEDED